MRAVGALSTVSHVFGKTLAEACGGSGEGSGGTSGESFIGGVVALLTVDMLGVVIVDVGVDPIESGPSKMSMSGSTWLTWSVKSVPLARRFGHARGSWARITDTHGLDYDVEQNLRSSITCQICVGGVVGEQLEWDVIEIGWSTLER
jgi:hypothetical protein